MTELQQAIDISQEVGSAFGEILSAQRLALVETRLGHHDTAHERLRSAWQLVAASDSMLVKVHSPTRILGTLSHNRLEADDMEGAAECLAQGFAAQQETGECNSCDVLLYPAAVPIYIALGDLEQAAWACRKAEGVAEAFGSQTWIANAYYLRGLLAKAHGELQDAKRWLQQAVDLFTGLPQPYEAALALEALAEVSAADGQSGDDPMDLLARATEHYQRLGSTSGVQRVRARMTHLSAE